MDSDVSEADGDGSDTVNESHEWAPTQETDSFV